MNNMKKRKLNKYFIFSLCVGLFVLTVMTVNKSVFVREVVDTNQNLSQVSNATYTPLTNGLPQDITNASNEQAGNLLGFFFRWGISIAVVLSIIMIMYGGLQYMTTDAYSGKSEGKEKITGAIIGLLLALSSFLILQEINPNIVDFANNIFLDPSSI
jgi:hypothetical protein